MPEVKLKPSKIIAVGLNYEEHIREMAHERPTQPVIFLKAPSALIYDGAEIVYPPQTRELSYEAELAVVIKDRTKNISVDDALRHVRGFTCGNDVTARDLQKLDGQWARAKSFDTFCPIGPRIVSGIDPSNLAIKSFLNGELRQSSSTVSLIFKVDYLIAFISQVMTLEPDDIILTGTPPGVGAMQAGDEIRIEIEGIGSLINKVKAGT